jgi:predicted nucleotidyltransferase
MIVAINLESELTLKLFKDFSKNYNSSSIAKEVDKSRMGAFKVLQSLETKEIIKGQTLGKARFYKFNTESVYAKKTVELLLMEEAKRFQRWVDEFKELYSHVTIAILFGSIINDEDKAKDIDLLLVYPEKNNSFVNSFIKEKNDILLKKIHLIKQTKYDLIRNLNKKDAVLLDVIRTGVVLHGFQEFVELMANVRSKE